MIEDIREQGTLERRQQKAAEGRALRIFTIDTLLRMFVT
jgi:hypothetical protein